MKTIRKVEFTTKFVEEIPRIELMEEAVLYVSEIYKTASHKCLCGCGMLTVTPLNNNGWQLTEKNNKVSLSPSIGNFQYPCKSHYIITNNVANFV